MRIIIDSEHEIGGASVKLLHYLDVTGMPSKPTVEYDYYSVHEVNGEPYFGTINDDSLISRIEKEAVHCYREMWG